MFRKQILWLLLILACVAGVIGMAYAAEVDCDSSYCFSSGDFSDDEALTGICITGLPDIKTGTVMLGTRVIRVGDILTAQQIERMTFQPLNTEADQEAVITYLPIYENRVEKSATMTISIRGKVDQTPVAPDQAMETYKNLENSDTLKATDPEGQALTYTVTRHPKRGTLTIHEDGTFTYAPKKNKVGVDSFTYTVTDPAGNVSREATVTITILKPSDGARYTDTVGSSCRFEAEWLKNSGLFVGEQVGGELFFNEGRPMSRGEFLAMAVKLLELPMDSSLTAVGYQDEIPSWLQPYLAAALRSGMTAGLSSTTFGAGESITGAEAAVMLHNALDLSVSVGAIDAVDESVPEWAVTAVAAMTENGVQIAPDQTLTRADVAVLLYQISKFTATAPGLQMYR
jgi:VCBS repeat-containing protein